MGVRVIIHGFIECPFDFRRWDHSRQIFEHNRAAIACLPKTDRNLLERSMFHVHPPKGIVPFYDMNLITFGGAYKNMYLFESDWLCVFEQLLARLCWHSASAFLQFGSLRCDWEAEQAHERAFADPPRPPLKWSASYFRLADHPVSFQEAVDAIYSRRKTSGPGPLWS